MRSLKDLNDQLDKSVHAVNLIEPQHIYSRYRGWKSLLNGKFPLSKQDESIQLNVEKGLSIRKRKEASLSIGNITSADLTTGKVKRKTTFLKCLVP